jgi:chromosome segregation ATPase
VSLSSKIVTTNDLEREISTVVNTVNQSEEARRGLHGQLSVASNLSNQRAGETQVRETELNNEVERLRQEVDELNNTIRARDQTIQSRDHTITDNNKEINNLNMKLADLSEMKNLNEKYEQQVNDAEKSRADLQKKYQQCLDDHQNQLKSEHEQRNKLIKEKNEISNQLKKAEQLISDLRTEIDQLNDTVDQRDQTIHDLQNRLLVLYEITKQRDELLENLKEFQASRDKLHKEIQALKVEFTDLRTLDNEHFTKIHTEKTNVEVVLTTRDNKITDLERRILEINSSVHMFKQQIDSSHAECHRLQDIEVQHSRAEEVHKEYTEDRVYLRKELERASDFMVDLEEKVHKANSTSLTLLSKTKEAEREVDVLKDYIYELKSRVAIYIPVREDPIDKKLSEYINNYPDRSKLKIMFMRESSGIYQFGSRKIYVRVEKDRIIIRVGGGYLTIDEFLDIYTPIELDRIERKGTNKKVIEKMAIQRTLIGRELREESPIRSPGKKARRKSPMKSPTKGGF